MGKFVDADVVFWGRGNAAGEWGFGMCLRLGVEVRV